jgi:Arc/MetJ family transcription regulator
VTASEAPRRAVVTPGLIDLPHLSLVLSLKVSLVTSLIYQEEHIMSRTVIDLDDDLLAAVAQALGTGTKKETVNTALAEVLESRRRALALARLRASAEEGAFALDLFQDKRDYRR